MARATRTNDTHTHAHNTHPRTQRTHTPNKAHGMRTHFSINREQTNSVMSNTLKKSHKDSPPKLPKQPEWRTPVNTHTHMSVNTNANPHTPRQNEDGQRQNEWTVEKKSWRKYVQPKGRTNRREDEALKWTMSEKSQWEVTLWTAQVAQNTRTLGEHEG